MYEKLRIFLSFFFLYRYITPLILKTTCVNFTLKKLAVKITVEVIILP